MSVYNFSPGPSKLHQDVIDKVEASIQKYDNTGKSILEISHRSNEFDELLENIKLNKWCNKTLITYDYESKNNKITISCK